ncbi:zinc finger protein 423-like isoform X11 [Mercenaria mercenaria]|uniref:zinc finger protein 423-like isoform X11 n=1 Tax=Mercenaria mercenaria TaxID=6596 RepID=UPI00234EF0FF|nr:zinc finger protein 423-like isoform X11 [Mercenaria mercenaria]
MESYLMMLYVTLEQESALKNFFVDQGWMFCKPDLSVTTDKLGPAVQNPPVVSEEISLPETDIPPQMKQTIPEIKINIPPSKPATGTSTVRRGKRKTKSPKQTAIRIKQAKVASASVPEPSESNENLVTEAVESNKSETLDTSKIKVPITVQVEDGNQFTIKIEQESEDVGNDKGEVDNSDVVGNDDFDDGDDDNDEETNVDYSFEGASTSEGDTSVKMESQSLGNNSTNVNTAAKGGSSGKGKHTVSKKCQFCDKVYISAGGLRKHTVVKHSHEDKKFICDLCGDAFYYKHELTQHRSYKHFSHLKMHVCKHCGMCFNTQRNLNHHERYHMDEEDKRYRCIVCSKAYHFSQELKRHMEIHKEKEICVKCNRPVVHMQIHMRRCGKPKQFKSCGICGKLVQKRSFKDHVDRVHTQVLKFECDKCGQKYKYWSSMNRHFLKCSNMSNKEEGSEIQ